jgi:hypothetical protein
MNEIKKEIVWLKFKRSGVTKTTKLDSIFTASSSACFFRVRRNNHDLIRSLVAHRRHDAPSRLFLRLMNHVLESHELWFAHESVGKKQISGAIKDYTPELMQSIDSRRRY